MNISVLGAGTWGLALARMLALDGYNVTVWSAFKSEVDDLSTNRCHKNLPGMVIPDSIVFTEDMAKACQDMGVIVFAVPSPFVRSTAAKAMTYIPDGQIIVDVAKGIEPDTLLTMTEVIKDELNKDGNHHNIKLVALSGPTHAEEVARDIPTAIVSACLDMDVAKVVQEVFSNTCMRTYTNTDVLGVELCGALKNIVALASGVVDGMGFGDNTRAALITRGIGEIRSLGMSMGANIQTFSGLAGIGDMIVTATSNNSRNFRAGQLIGKGVPVPEAVSQIGMVVEGIHALNAAVKLAAKYHVDMPIIMAVDAVVNHGADPRQELARLMVRPKRSEIETTEVETRFESSLYTNRRNKMKRVITYGTFDMLHYGHINLLKRAKAMGDYLVVALSTDEFNWNEKQKKCYFTYEQRKALLESIRYVDLVIPEENWDQKRTDIHDYNIDTFVIGDDWKGKFDFLEEEGAEVVYLSRTPEISTTQIKSDLKK